MFDNLGALSSAAAAIAIAGFISVVLFLGVNACKDFERKIMLERDRQVCIESRRKFAKHYVDLSKNTDDEEKAEEYLEKAFNIEFNNCENKDDRGKQNKGRRKNGRIRIRHN